MNRRRVRLAGAAALAALLLAGAPLALRGRAGHADVRIGSKKFTESVVLGETLRLLAEREGARSEHEEGLGGSRIVFDALLAGDLDAYVEYTGTLRHELLAREHLDSLAALGAWLGKRGVTLGPQLGFENTYALGMRRARAEALGIRTIGDLRAHPDLTMGLSHEFLERKDGWPGLVRRYGLPQADVKGLDHDLAYRAVASGAADVTDLYSTDAKIERYDLVTLEDDLHYFPEYDAVVLYRTSLGRRHPEVVRAFRALEGRIDARTMIRANAKVDVDHESETVAAAELLRTLGIAVSGSGESLGARLLRTTGEHVGLVGASLGAAILLGLLLGVVAAGSGRAGQALLGVVGAAQTFPGLALLALMIPLLGIGWLPTFAALVVYSLLPIVRNTYAGLLNVPRPLAESARVLGLSPRDRLLRVQLPLAAPSILAGVQTAAVWNVGLATVGGLIGAGGYGQTIFEGIRTANDARILEGALAAMGLALLVQVAFEGVQRLVVSPGLRRPRA